MLISPAHAQAAGAAGGGDIFVQLMPLLLIFVVFWFLLIRPQQKRAKEHKAMIAAVHRGDQIITGGGVWGKVTKVIDDDTVQVEIAENVRVKIVRSTIQSVVSRGEPVRREAKKDDAGGASGGKEEKKSLFSFGSKK